MRKPSGRATLACIVIAAGVLALLLLRAASGEPSQAPASEPGLSAAIATVPPAPAPVREAPRRADPPLTPRAADEAAEPAPDDPESVSISVRDLADGSPVPGLRLVVATGARLGGPDIPPVCTDELGCAVLPVDALDDIAPAAPFSRAPEQSGDGVCRARELWVYRDVELVVTVQAECPDLAPPQRPTLDSWILAGAPGVIPVHGKHPWSNDWLHRHRMHGQMSQQAVDGKWPQRIKAPRVRGLALVARMPGMRPAYSRVEVDSRTESVAVHLTAMRFNTITGTLLDEAGEPMAGVSVTAFLEHRVAPTEIDYDSYLVLGHAVTWIWNPTMALGRLTLVSGAKTGPTGKFKIVLNADGNTMVEARVAGRRVARTAAFMTSGDVGGADLRLAPAPTPRRVVLAVGSERIANADIMIFDVSSEVGQQMAVAGCTGSDGEMDVTELEPGREYYVHMPTRRRGSSYIDSSGYLVWNDQPALDVEKDLRPVR